MRTLLLLPLLAGCEIRGDECVAPMHTWSTQARTYHAAGGADGTVLATIDVDGSIDGMSPAAPSIARVSAASGQVLAFAPVTTAAATSASLRSDDAGGGVVLFYSNPVTLVRFDAMLTPMWTRMVAPGMSFDAGPLGDAAYVSEGRLHYIDAGGVEAWSVPEFEGEVRLGLQGDVFVIDEVTAKRRHYASGGALLDEVQLDQLVVPTDNVRLARDGSVTFVNVATRSVLGRIDAAGALVWTHDLSEVAQAQQPPFVSMTGQVLVLVGHANRIMRLDSGTGALVATHDNCHPVPENDVNREIVSADDESYVLHDDAGFTRFVGP
jgi:hypothetical protein